MEPASIHPSGVGKVTMMDQIGRFNAVFKASFFDLSQILCLYFVFPLVYLSSTYYQKIK